MDIIYGATGKIDIYVNDTFKKTVRVGSSAYLNDLNVGLNVIKVVYRGDDYFESSENITTVIVNKVNSSITFNNDIVFNYGSSGSTLMTVNGVTDINAFVINHTEAIVKVKNNRITVANLDIGNYTLVAITIPDDNHYSVNTTANIIVNKLESQISIPTIIFNYNGSTTVNANVVGVTDIINVKVENHQEAMIYVYGTEITVSNLDAGNYTLVATTVPDKNYKSVNTTALIIVNKINSTINFTNDLVFDYGSSDYTIVNIEYATNITNIKVKNHPEAIIYADNNIITVSGLNAGSYTLSATTVPDKNHNAVTGTTKITVNKINSTLNVDDEIIFNYGDSGIANAEYNGATAINAYVTDIIDPNVIHGGITIDGKNITISYLNAGEYLLHVYTIPDNNHYSVSNVAKITVNKANPIITLSPIIFDYGGTGLTKLITNDNIDFNATVVNHQDALINIEDKKIWVSNLEAGNYILKVNTYSNENYNAFNLNTNITVNKIDSFVSASDIIFDYGFYGSTKFDLDGAININASIINHTEAIVGIVNNEIYISSLNAGTYYLNITTIPDDNHKSVTIIPLVTVNKVNSSIFIPTIVFDYDDSTTVSPILDGVAKITYAFVTNHKEALVEISDNNEITVSGLNAGRYMLVVTTEPDDNHNPISSVTADIVVNKIDSTIFIPEINFNYGLYGSTKVILSGATKFKANIDGDTTHLSINDDVIVIFGLNAGTYDLTVTTVPDTNHNAVNSVSKIIVNKLGTVLTSSDVTGVYGTSKNLIVKLNDVNGNLLVGESITVNLNNVMYSGHIGSNGQVIINIPSYLPAKSYVATITYGGNTNHEKSTSTIKITVKKATPKLTAKSKTFKKSVKTKKYTMTLKDNQNKAMKNAKVTIKINKKTYTAKTNSKGVATFKIKKLTKKGTFKSKVTYKGDKCYNKITKTVKIKVK